MATPKAKAQVDPAGAGIKVIHTKNCPSLSGKSIITYKLGVDSSNCLHIRLHENTGGGFFNDDWYPAQEIVALLRALGKVESVTSRAIAPLSRGRSVNTPAFLAAVLRNEGVLLAYKRTCRYHVIGDLDAFLNQSGNFPRAKAAKTGPRKANPSKVTKTTPRKATKKTPVKKR